MNDQIHPEEHTEQEQPDLSPERPHPRQRSWSGTLTLAFSFLAMLLAGMALLLAVLDRPAKEPEEEPAGPATFQFGEQTLEVLEGMPLQPYDWRSFSTESLGGGRRRAVYRQNGRSARTGIDISFYQGDIDWQAVAGDGIDFVILRLGYRGYTEGGLMQDKNYVQNLQGALNAGLDVGVYFFSQAITPQEAEEEADYILSVLNGAPLAYPIAFDWEPIAPGNDARTSRRSTSTRTWATSSTTCGSWRTASSGWRSSTARPSSITTLTCGSTAIQARWRASRVRWTWTWTCAPSWTPKRLPEPFSGSAGAAGRDSV